MRIHLVAFPHTRVEASFSTCAYTQKVLKFCRMMGGRHELVVYSPEGPEIEGAEHVAVYSEEARLEMFGPDDPERLPAWPTEEQWTGFNVSAAMAINERSEPRDVVLLFGGYSQRVLAAILGGELLLAEPGVGYEGPVTNFRSFESYAWMHYLYGKLDQDGRWYDVVIPNFFDLEEFTFSPDRGDYLLYMGRLIGRKGIAVAARIAELAEMPLLVAGPGATAWRKGRIKVHGEPDVTGPVEYVGVASGRERAELLAGAAALLAPTTYIEPFGGVAVEAMLSGTPVVSTDWGAFTETVVQGVGGYRFRSLAGGVEALRDALELDRGAVNEYAAGRYSLEAIAPLFDGWFERLGTLWGHGWETLPSSVAVA